MSAFCTACGGARTPLANTSVNMAGQPSKVGGTVARVFGWLSLAVGNVVALGLLGACGAIVGFDAAAPYIIGLPIAVVATVLGLVLLRGGRDLKQAGENTEKATRGQAIYALANTRGGVLTPVDVAHAINVTPPEADAILTQIAKEQPDHVTVDVDDDGQIFYRFDAAHWRALAANPALWERPAPRARVGVAQRVDAGPTGARIDARDPLEDELEEPAARPAAQRMR